MTKNKSAFCSVLTTPVEWITYEFDTHRGELYQPDDVCCDMTECIAAFMTLDPDVWWIRTWSGDREDTTYKRQGKQWYSRDRCGNIFRVVR